MSEQDSSTPPRLVVIRMVARNKTGQEVFLGDTSNFLYDTLALYEVVRIATDSDYDRFVFSQYAYFRHGRPLKVRDKLRVRRLREESPLEIVAVLTGCFGVVGAIWAYVQTYEKIANLSLNKEKLRLEVKKLELEVREKEMAVRERELTLMREYEDETVLQNRLASRGASSHYRVLQHRLEKSPLRLEHLDIHVEVPDSPDEDHHQLPAGRPKGSTRR